MNKFHGTVKAIREYGVMVENHEYKDCLLHISDISWRKLKYSDLLKMIEKSEI